MRMRLSLPHPFWRDPEPRAARHGGVIASLTRSSSWPARPTAAGDLTGAREDRSIPHGIPDVGFRRSHLFQDQFDVEGRWCCSPLRLVFAPTRQFLRICVNALPQSSGGSPRLFLFVLGATNVPTNCGRRPSLPARSRNLPRKNKVTEVIFYNQSWTREPQGVHRRRGPLHYPYLNERRSVGTLAMALGAQAVFPRPTGMPRNCGRRPRRLSIRRRRAIGTKWRVCGTTTAHAIPRMPTGSAANDLESNVAQMYMRSFEGSAGSDGAARKSLPQDGSPEPRIRI